LRAFPVFQQISSFMSAAATGLKKQFDRQRRG
jgi:hypothetical protein